MKFERLSDESRKEVIDIFNFYVMNTTAAFRDEKVDYSFFDNLIDDGIDDAQYVIKNGKEVIGFSLLEYFMPMRTFRETAEVTYFIKKEYTGKGIGQKTLEILENDAKRKGIKTLIAIITSDNRDSIRFHRKNGFTKYGELEKGGIKFNNHFNIIYMKKSIMG